MTPAQCRAARALADMTQAELAARSAVGVATIKNFEAGRSVPMARTLRDIIAALEAAGVEFLNHDQPGVRLALPAAKPRGKK